MSDPGNKNTASWLCGGLDGGRYEVRKRGNDPQADPEAKYFPLRYDSDPHARTALLAYAQSVASENGKLAIDLILAVADQATDVAESRVCNSCVLNVLRTLRLEQ